MFETNNENPVLSKRYMKIICIRYMEYVCLDNNKEKFFIKSFFDIIGSRKVNNINSKTLSSCNVKIKIYFIKFCSWWEII